MCWFLPSFQLYKMYAFSSCCFLLRMSELHTASSARGNSKCCFLWVTRRPDNPESKPGISGSNRPVWLRRGSMSTAWPCTPCHFQLRTYTHKQGFGCPTLHKFWQIRLNTMFDVVSAWLLSLSEISLREIKMQFFIEILYLYKKRPLFRLVSEYELLYPQLEKRLWFSFLLDDFTVTEDTVSLQLRPCRTRLRKEEPKLCAEVGIWSLIYTKTFIWK